MDGTTVSHPTTTGAEQYTLNMKVTAPKFTNTSTYKNHGEFVKQSPDKNDAAHSCIGMPVNSSK
jgi:hypothetical protein